MLQYKMVRPYFLHSDYNCSCLRVEENITFQAARTFLFTLLFMSGKDLDQKPCKPPTPNLNFDESPGERK